MNNSEDIATALKALVGKDDLSLKESEQLSKFQRTLDRLNKKLDKLGGK